MPLHTLFFELPLPHFALVLVLRYHFFFEPLSIFYFLEDIIGHLVHEVLGSLFSGLHLVDSVSLLLVKHSGVLFLRPEVIESLFLLDLLLPSLVLLVFLKHLLKVFSFLPSLLQLHASFGLHLGL